MYEPGLSALAFAPAREKSPAHAQFAGAGVKAIDGPGHGPELRELPIASVRKDGHTQHRTVVDPKVIAEYAALISEGAVFSPVTVWFDGTDYWLTDGFQRTAATERAGRDRIAAEIHHGPLSEAQWHSYAANASHGLRRTTPDAQVVVRLALQHPKAASLTDVQLARHLHIPETTLRRWRQKLSSPRGDDSHRVVTRGKSTEALRTGGINKSRKGQRAKTRADLRRELVCCTGGFRRGRRALWRSIGATVSHLSLRRGLLGGVVDYGATSLHCGN
jgi:transposase-like protein